MKLLIPSNKIARTSIFVLLGLSILLYLDNVTDMISDGAIASSVALYTLVQFAVILFGYIIWTFPLNYMNAKGLLDKYEKIKIFGYLIVTLFVIRCLDYIAISLTI